jgi:hypothetical protein
MTVLYNTILNRQYLMDLGELNQVVFLLTSIIMDTMDLLIMVTDMVIHIMEDTMTLIGEVDLV